MTQRKGAFKLPLHIVISGICALLGMYPTAGHTDVIFTFAETGGTVTMTSSGTLDTTNLVLSGQVGGWGGTGIENNPTPGDIDIMGGTSFGGVNIAFGFNVGTDATAITNPGGPFSLSDFSVASITGSKSFTTYSGFSGGFRQPGIGIVNSNIIGGLWTPDQNWTFGPGATFASLGLIIGTYSVSDIITGETITIEVASVPEPATLLLLGIGLVGVAVRGKRRLTTLRTELRCSPTPIFRHCQIYR